MTSFVSEYLDKLHKRFPWIPAMILTSGVILTLYFFSMLLSVHYQQIRDHFLNDSERISNRIEGALAKKVVLINTLKTYFQSSEDVTRNYFGEYSKEFLNYYHDIQTFIWIPNVEHSERDLYEVKARRLGLERFQFKELYTGNRIDRARKRSIYYPSYFVEPMTGNEKFLGFDMGTINRIKICLEEARDTNSIKALLGKHAAFPFFKESTLLIVAPVYVRDTVDFTLEGRRRNILGFILGLIDLNSLISASMPETMFPDIHVLAYNPDSLDSINPFFSSREHITNSQINLHKPGLIRTTEMNISNCKFYISVLANNGYFGLVPFTSQWYVLVFGMTFSILLGVLFYMQRNRTKRIEQAVTERTSELKSMNERLASEIAQKKEAQRILLEAKNDTEKTNRKLQQSMKQAQSLAIRANAASNAKSHFLANISHEIKTPMNGIIGMLDLLLDNSLTPEQKDYTRIAQTSSKNLLDTLNSILDYSKIESGRLKLENTDFNLLDLVDDITDLFTPMARSKKLQYSCLVEHDVPFHLHGDPNRLRQILINLISNAFKFTSAGEIALHIKRHKKTKQYIEIRFSIRDTGIGIPSDKLLDLFEPFTQVDPSITRKHGGSGLGLSICKNLVKLMDGKIDVNSRADCGSDFWFTARFQKPEVFVMSLYQDNQKLVNLLQSKRILVLTTSSNSDAVKMLSALSCRTTVSSDPANCISLIRTAHQDLDPFQILIMDDQVDAFNPNRFICTLRNTSEGDAMVVCLLFSLKSNLNAILPNQEKVDLILRKPLKQWNFIKSLVVAAKDYGNYLESIATTDETEDTVLPEIASSKILIADDHLVNQKVATAVVKALGLKSHAVFNGKEALDALEKCNYNLILMDLQMPVLDGISATRMIRTSGKSYKHIPIIAMTAYGADINRHESLKAGMNAYITKPVNPDKLRSILRKHLKLTAKFNHKTKRNSTESNSRLFLKDELLQRIDGDLDCYNDLIDLYKTDVTKKLKKLRSDVTDEKWTDVKTTAHTLKGSSRSISSPEMADLAEKLEKLAENKIKPKLIDLIDTMENNLKKLTEIMKPIAPTQQQS